MGGVGGATRRRSARVQRPRSLEETSGLLKNAGLVIGILVVYMLGFLASMVGLFNIVCFRVDLGCAEAVSAVVTVVSAGASSFTRFDTSPERRNGYRNEIGIGAMRTGFIDGTSTIGLTIVRAIGTARIRSRRRGGGGGGGGGRGRRLFARRKVTTQPRSPADQVAANDENANDHRDE